MNELVSVGTIGTTHGLKGEMKALIESPYEADFAAAKAVFINTKRGKPLPYFVEQIRGKDTPLLKLEGIDSKESAALLRHGEVWLRAEDISPTTEPGYTEETLNYLVGYQLIDETAGEIGTIEEIIELPQHSLASVIYKGREIYIPLHDDLVTELDEEKQQLLVDLPEGLLEL